MARPFPLGWRFKTARKRWYGSHLTCDSATDFDLIDLWSLPERRRTDALADLIESHFYAAVPPDQRPRHHFEQTEIQQDSASTDEVSNENEKDIKMEKAKVKKRLAGNSGLAVKQDVDSKSGKKKLKSK